MFIFLGSHLAPRASKPQGARLVHDLLPNQARSRASCSFNFCVRFLLICLSPWPYLAPGNQNTQMSLLRLILAISGACSHIWQYIVIYIYIYIYISEVGGVSPTGKSFRVVPCGACVRARGLVVEWEFA